VEKDSFERNKKKRVLFFLIKKKEGNLHKGEVMEDTDKATNGDGRGSKERDC